MVVVVGVDRSDHAEDVIEEAGILADAFGDGLRVVHVLTRSEVIDLERTSVESGHEALDINEIKAIAEQIVDEAADGVIESYESVGLVGDTAHELIRYAEDQNARYIVLGPRRRSPAGKAIFGSVAQSVLLNANCPVVTTIRT